MSTYQPGSFGRQQYGRCIGSACVFSVHSAMHAVLYLMVAASRSVLIGTDVKDICWLGFDSSLVSITLIV